jgi:hypothetical protein
MPISGEEFKEFSYFINNIYEPKKKNRFMLHIASIPLLSTDSTVKAAGDTTHHSGLMISLIKAQRPNYTVTDSGEIYRFHERSFYAGRPEIETKMTCSFNDYINNAAADGTVSGGLSASQILYRWFNTVYNIDFGSMGFKNEYATTADLFLLDPHGKQIEQWHYTNFWITSINYGDVDFSSSDNITIETSFRYDKVKMIKATDTAAAPGVYSSSEYS